VTKQWFGEMIPSTWHKLTLRKDSTGQFMRTCRIEERKPAMPAALGAPYGLGTARKSSSPEVFSAPYGSNTSLRDKFVDADYSDVERRVALRFKDREYAGQARCFRIPGQYPETAYQQKLGSKDKWPRGLRRRITKRSRQSAWVNGQDGVKQWKWLPSIGVTKIINGGTMIIHDAAKYLAWLETTKQEKL